MAKRLTYDEILEKTKDTDFQIIEAFQPKNVHIEVKVICKKCKTVHMKRLNSLLHNYGCNFCNKKHRTVKSFKEELKTDFYDDFILVKHGKESDIILTRDKVNLVHRECGNQFEIKLHCFVTNNQRCPICRRSGKSVNEKSNGVKEIEKVLTLLDLKFQNEYSFDDLRGNGNKRLPFDIYVKDLNLLIEYDGLQHFQPIDYYGGEERFVRCQELDNIKNSWCVKKDISLIRIPYTEKDVRKSLLALLFEERSTTSPLWTYCASDWHGKREALLKVKI